MRLPIYKRINREDITEAPDWIGRLLYPINNFMETVYSAMNKNLSFADNLQSFIKSIEFTTSTTYVSAGDWQTVSFAIPDTFKARVTGVVLVGGGPKTASPKDCSGIWVSWSENNRAVDVEWIGGLKDSTDYSFTLLVI